MATSGKSPKGGATGGAEVARTGESPFAIVQLAKEAGGDNALAQVMADNTGGGGITPFDLDRVKVPSGGSKAWELPTLGDPEVARTFDGIIVHWREPRSYWKNPLDETGGGSPPDCSSVDGITGVGDPGGTCAVCPMAQWGSARNASGGQACKQMRLLFVVRESALLPLALFAPPTSIAPLKKYFLRLASQGKRYSDVVTTFSLGTARSGGGIEYSVIEPSVQRILDGIERDAVLEYSKSIAGAIQSIRLTADDVTPG